jgi:hypothetical protein
LLSVTYLSQPSAEITTNSNCTICLVIKRKKKKEFILHNFKAGHQFIVTENLDVWKSRWERLPKELIFKLD